MSSAATSQVAPQVPLEDFAARLHPVQVIGSLGGVVVSSVTYDHRSVTPGALHCCLVGERVDGHEFAPAAALKGAVAFVCERLLEDEAASVVQLLVGPGGARRAMALAACVLWGDPASSLKTVGVTGTNGKTTTTYFLRAVLEEHGWPTAVIGTLGGPRTTPEAPDLQRALAHARDSNRSAVALEVSSHALAQHRLDGYRHDVVVFTNLSQDHLDYHGTMQAYFEAKELLFTPEHAFRAVVNEDDPFGRRLLETVAIPVGAFSIGQAEQLDVGLEESRFRLDGEPVRVRPGGEINVRNALAAAAAARALGVPAATIAAGLSAATGPAGRLEAVPTDIGVEVVVDYAHTPAGLMEILKAARAEAGPRSGKVIVVFGCGGDRDRDKRPMMGSVATKLADVAVLTSDNPRSEDPDAIIAEVRAGCDGTARLVIEPDRRRAIAAALEFAGGGDVVVVAGKGHETVQEIGDRLIEFSDRQVLAEELARITREGTGK
ncbi:MAG: UDP-N-acetylmuramoyl-L-alanyl-D-glutamate--2,6-diaminopimelate ligase [Acidimicrobiales bacterium]|jgi:UDP-N-acetylmuramoyl-L-alanyl-D-glutamate--2,6-diaminopimelate ligase